LRQRTLAWLRSNVFERITDNGEFNWAPIMNQLGAKATSSFVKGKQRNGANGDWRRI
jgi:hypothetical protein